MLCLLFILLILGCTEGECPSEDLSLAPRPYAKPENLLVCKKPFRGPNCTCPSTMFECACHKFGHCGDKPGCIPMWRVNNDFNECGDWSDEFGDICPQDRFQCDCFNTTCKGVVGCVIKRYHCDGTPDCLDGTDEVCNRNDFLIVNPPKSTYVPIRGMLVGIPLLYGVCEDSSIESNCPCPGYQFECDCYKTNTCPNTTGCIHKSQRCDGISDCGDLSDEVNCTCSADEFKCSCLSTKQCIGMKGSCVDRSMLCDGNRDCFDGSDETHYTCNCSGLFARCPCDPGNKHCPPTGRCIPFDWLGDNVTDCSDGSDETCSVSNFICHSCTMFVTTCRTEQSARYLVNSDIPAKCNRIIQPSCADDIRNCKIKKVICVASSCTKTDTFCQNIFTCEKQEIIPESYFCDPVSSCSDNSDEIKAGFGFKCSGSSRKGVCVLSQAHVYDSVAQCSDKSDLCFVNGEFKCFQCLDKKLIISPKQVCDGIVDCFDMSDECLCLNQSLCNDIRGTCPLNEMHCQNKSECSLHYGKLCNSSVQCFGQTNTKYFTPSHNLQKTQCLPENYMSLGLDEIFKCARNDNKPLRTWFQFHLDSEMDAKLLLNSICDGKIDYHFQILDEMNCPNMFYCFLNGQINIKNSQVCDGKVDCDDGSDEFIDLCHNTRFYCKSKDRVSIDRKTLRDGIVDCDNESDESRCRCKKKRFYCANKQPLSVDLKLVQNGIRDCSDGSDEFAETGFADFNEMIANPIYRVIFWITGVLALGGNLFVFIATARSLYGAKKKNNVFINTSVFILNLSCSDFLMGIYLLAVVVQGTQYSGSYYSFDKEWRSSSLCSGLGALAIVSSQASAFTMAAMTTFRLVSVFKPFKIGNVRVEIILLVELFCWILAVALATVPLLQGTSEYFTTDVWFPNNIFRNDIVSRENISLLAERITGMKPKRLNDVKQIIKKTFPRNYITKEFGYYGETLSVCMPRLFATTSEFAWEYSTGLITINFLMFIYMVVAYVVIYKVSNSMKGSRSTDVSSEMQKRISRLIVTVFCCWIPICVMGYISVGGIKMPPDAYLLSACLLLPVNSALNPLLYSKAIEDLFTRATKSIVEKTLFFRVSTTGLPDSAVKYNVNAEAEGDRVIEIVR